MLKKTSIMQTVCTRLSLLLYVFESGRLVSGMSSHKILRLFVLRSLLLQLEENHLVHQVRPNLHCNHLFS